MPNPERIRSSCGHTVQVRSDNFSLDLIWTRDITAAGPEALTRLDNFPSEAFQNLANTLDQFSKLANGEGCKEKNG